jgi:hypothetical protein
MHDKKNPVDLRDGIDAAILHHAQHCSNRE